MLWKILPARIYQFWFLAVVSLAVISYFVLGRQTATLFGQKFLNRQQVLARAGSINISSFFQEFGNSVSVLAQLKSITNPTSSVWESDIFVKEWSDSGFIGGVALADRNGVVRLNSNILGTRNVGFSLADRDYFLWAKNEAKEGEYFIGSPVISRGQATEGQVIVPVASPVYQNGVFQGVVVTSPRLKDLAEHFLNLMKVSDSTRVYLINKEGNVLYTNSDSILQELDNLKDRQEEGTLKTPTHLTAYSPIILGEQNWLIVMSSPSQEVSDFTAPLFIRLMAIILPTFLTFLFLGAVSIREVRGQNNLE